MKTWMGPVLAILRHYISTEVIEAIKARVLEALAHDEWSHGEKTEFVMDAVRDVVAATPTKIDDILVEVAIRIYLAKYAKG